VIPSVTASDQGGVQSKLPVGRGWGKLWFSTGVIWFGARQSPLEHGAKEGDSPVNDASPG